MKSIFVAAVFASASTIVSALPIVLSELNDLEARDIVYLDSRELANDFELELIARDDNEELLARGPKEKVFGAVGRLVEQKVIHNPRRAATAHSTDKVKDTIKHGLSGSDVNRKGMSPFSSRKYKTRELFDDELVARGPKEKVFGTIGKLVEQKVIHNPRRAATAHSTDKVKDTIKHGILGSDVNRKGMPPFSTRHKTRELTDDELVARGPKEKVFGTIGKLVEQKVIHNPRRAATAHSTDKVKDTIKHGLSGSDVNRKGMPPFSAGKYKTRELSDDELVARGPKEKVFGTIGKLVEQKVIHNPRRAATAHSTDKVKDTIKHGVSGSDVNRKGMPPFSTRHKTREHVEDGQFDFAARDIELD